jgi:hypothetical protein
MTKRKPTTSEKVAKSFIEAPSTPAEKVAKFIYENTIRAYGSLFLDEDSKPLSEKAQKIQDYINTHMSGDYRRHAANLFSELLGETICIKNDFVERFEPHTMLVPINNDNGHDYALNQPILHLSSSRGNSFLKVVGGYYTHGNNLTTRVTSLRLPTPKEVLEFIQVDEPKLMSLLGVVVL